MIHVRDIIKEFALEKMESHAKKHDDALKAKRLFDSAYHLGSKFAYEDILEKIKQAEKKEYNLNINKNF